MYGTITAIRHTMIWSWTAILQHDFEAAIHCGGLVFWGVRGAVVVLGGCHAHTHVLFYHMQPGVENGTKRSWGLDPVPERSPEHFSIMAATGITILDGVWS